MYKYLIAVNLVFLLHGTSEQWYHIVLNFTVNLNLLRKQSYRQLIA
jgi:hypothetical protein